MHALQLVGGKAWLLYRDWFFAASPAASDRMGEATSAFHSYAALQAKETGLVSTHFIWPYHAVSSGLAIRWGLLDATNFSLTRDLQDSHVHAKAQRCFYATSTPIAGEMDRNVIPPQMRGQCPFERAMECSCG